MQALKNTLFRLVIPTIIFSSLIYLPKVMFHGASEFSISKFVFDVFGGISYWFTSALTVAQIVLLTLFLSRRTNIGFYVGVSATLFVLGLWLNSQHPSMAPEVYFPWFYCTGLEYTFIMVLGGIYMKYEKVMNQFLSPWILCLLGIAYVMTLLYTYDTGLLKFMGVGGLVNIGGFLVVLCGIVLIIELCKVLPPTKWIEYIGRNSIIFYFFSGVMPAMVGKVAGMVFPNRMYVITIIVTICSLLCSYILTLFINRYLPFLIDLRKIALWKKVKD